MKNNKIRVTIIGSHGTGKTVIAKLISEKLNLPLITEVARNYDLKKIDRKSNIEKFRTIQKKILNDQLFYENSYENFVSDRSTIDNLAYWLSNCYSYASDNENEIYLSRSLNNVSNYSHIFLIKPEFSIKDDGFRDLDPIYQKKIEIIIDTILQIQKIRYFLLTGTISERLNYALKLIK
jgi:nicotinamide riboside kinase